MKDKIYSSFEEWKDDYDPPTPYYPEFILMAKDCWKARNAEIQELKDKVEKLKKCAEFYAEVENWIIRSDSTWKKRIPNDEEQIRNYKHPNTSWIGTCTVGGKLARQTLKEIEG